MSLRFIHPETYFALLLIIIAAPFLSSNARQYGQAINLLTKGDMNAKSIWSGKSPPANPISANETIFSPFSSIMALDQAPSLDAEASRVVPFRSDHNDTKATAPFLDSSDSWQLTVCESWAPLGASAINSRFEVLKLFLSSADITSTAAVHLTFASDAGPTIQQNVNITIPGWKRPFECAAAEPSSAWSCAVWEGPLSRVLLPDGVIESHPDVFIYQISINLRNMRCGERECAAYKLRSVKVSLEPAPLCRLTVFKSVGHFLSTSISKRDATDTPSVDTPIAEPALAPVDTFEPALAPEMTAEPSSTPSLAPATTPNAAPVSDTPASLPESAPENAPVGIPFAPLVDVPITPPVASPTAGPVTAPAATPIVGPVAPPVASPILGPVAAPMMPAPAAQPTRTWSVYSATVKDFACVTIYTVNGVDVSYGLHGLWRYTTQSNERHALIGSIRLNVNATSFTDPVPSVYTGYESNTYQWMGWLYAYNFPS
eukprot:TRINITY_DN2610_c0_g1_i2.p1 TRINITY_DN2610_c0_g1~~TRINITY_DN2610_c0_g1_i2.p1  ORF type:complete len:487 (-),score=39.10 TRINITY_DN2610_c0_g1_i2:664-2124(-)